MKIGMDLPISRYAYNMEEAMAAAEAIGFPIIIRASYTLAGAEAVSRTTSMNSKCSLSADSMNLRLLKF